MAKWSPPFIIQCIIWIIIIIIFFILWVWWWRWCILKPGSVWCNLYKSLDFQEGASNNYNSSKSNKTFPIAHRPTPTPASDCYAGSYGSLICR